MIFAASPGDASYDIVLLLHILTVVVGGGAAFVIPLASRHARTAGDDATSAGYQILHDTAQKLVAPGIILSGIFGGALIGQSKGADGELLWDFSQTWVIVGSLLWLIASGMAVWLVMLQRARKSGEMASDTVKKFTGMASGILHLLIVVLIYLMIFKPGV